MNVTTRKASLRGTARPRRRAFSISSTGSSASGNGRLPEDTDQVTIIAFDEAGVDKSTSNMVSISFDLGDDTDHLDALIGKLTDLRAKQRALAAHAEAVFASTAPRIGWESPPCEHYAGKPANVVREIDGVKFEDALCTIVAGRPGRKL